MILQSDKPLKRKNFGYKNTGAKLVFGAEVFAL